ncbi:MAG: hypothetical protein IJK89_12720 [Clostridia bacterium]|nr:hypothetical protein [Clostridia bacterium]
MKMIPLKKQSKKKQREHYAARRGTWGGLSPVTRVVKNKKGYDRKRLKEEDRKTREE